MPVITFSRYFPKGHPRAGEPTHFVEKILKCFIQNENLGDDPTEYSEWWCELLGMQIATVAPQDVARKYHTIRAGNRFKAGDKFSPRVWSGKPYASKQIQFAPDIEIKKIWTFWLDENFVPSINCKYLFDEYNSQNWDFDELAKNDGLSTKDLIDWFKCHPKKNTDGFAGQILCWNESIEY